MMSIPGLETLEINQKLQIILKAFHGLNNIYFYLSLNLLRQTILNAQKYNKNSIWRFKCSDVSKNIFQKRYFVAF